MKQLIVIVSAVVAAVGAVDAVAGNEWDLLAVFGLIALLQVALALTMHRRRATIEVTLEGYTWEGDLLTDLTVSFPPSAG